jgi:hypothetical protein
MKYFILILIYFLGHTVASSCLLYGQSSFSADLQARIRYWKYRDKLYYEFMDTTTLTPSDVDHLPEESKCLDERFRGQHFPVDRIDYDLDWNRSNYDLDTFKRGDRDIINQVTRIMRVRDPITGIEKDSTIIRDSTKVALIPSFRAAGDGPARLGWYIAVLASEWHLLHHNEQSTLQTEKEIYYALRAIERLDMLCERYMDNADNFNKPAGPCLRNGFMMRSDIPGAYPGGTDDRGFPTLRRSDASSSFFGEPWVINRDHGFPYEKFCNFSGLNEGWFNGAGEGLDRDNAGWKDNLMSKDHYIDLFWGYGHLYNVVLKHYPDIGYGGYRFKPIIQDMVKKMMGRIIDSPDMMIRNIHGKPVDKGTNFWMGTFYPLARIADDIREVPLYTLHPAAAMTKPLWWTYQFKDNPVYHVVGSAADLRQMTLNLMAVCKCTTVLPVPIVLAPVTRVVNAVKRIWSVVTRTRYEPAETILFNPPSNCVALKGLLRRWPELSLYYFSHLMMHQGRNAPINKPDRDGANCDDYDYLRAHLLDHLQSAPCEGPHKNAINPYDPMASHVGIIPKVTASSGWNVGNRYILYDDPGATNGFSPGFDYMLNYNTYTITNGSARDGNHVNYWRRYLSSNHYPQPSPWNYNVPESPYLMAAMDKIVIGPDFRIDASTDGGPTPIYRAHREIIINPGVELNAGTYEVVPFACSTYSMRSLEDPRIVRREEDPPVPETPDEMLDRRYEELTPAEFDTILGLVLDSILCITRAEYDSLNSDTVNVRILKKIFDCYKEYSGDTTPLFTREEPSPIEASSSSLSPKDLESPLARLRKVSIYPSPFTESFSLSFTIAADARVTVELCNALGQTIRTCCDNTSYAAGSHTQNIDGRGLAGGTYFAKILIDGAVVKTVPIMKVSQ